jgi:[ribosomal protein S5]-alanine N-acetyltransferase
MTYIDPRPIELHTPRLILRPFTLDECDRIATIANDPRVADTVLSIAIPYTLAHAQEFFHRHDAWWREGTAFVFALRLRDVAGSAGIIGFTGLHPKTAWNQAELGYWLGVDYWNQGFATEAARALCTWGFADRRFHRIFAHHMTKNPASGRVMEKLGMHDEGCMREAIRKGDEYRDVKVFGVLAREWQS